MAAQSKLIDPDSPRVQSLFTRTVKGYTRNRKTIRRLVWLLLFLSLARRIKNAMDDSAKAKRDPEKKKIDQAKAKKVAVDRIFFERLQRILKIVIPGIKSKEFLLLITHTSFLIIRTFLSLYVAELDGRIVAGLVRGKGRDFVLGLVAWMAVAIPATYTNSMVGRAATS